VITRISAGAWGLCALIGIAACKEYRVSDTEIGSPQTVALGGATYTIEWVAPGTPPLNTWGPVSFRTAEPYSGHVHPLYNLQEDLPAAPPEDNDWGGLWERLASDLAGRVEWYALAAFDRGELAGMIRFFPKTMTGPRYGAWSPEEHRREWTDEILWIGGGCVDMPGTEHGLDVELVRRVVEYARKGGYARIQGLGWGNVPVYAKWGQSFPVSVYDELGFRHVAPLDGTGLHALPDMLAGAHGEPTQRQVREAMTGSGLTEADANTFYIVELDCR